MDSPPSPSSLSLLQRCLSAPGGGMNVTDGGSNARLATRRFIEEDFRTTFPYRNGQTAKYELRRRFIPHSLYVKPLTVEPMNDGRLHELKVHHGMGSRARTARRQEVKEEVPTASQRKAKKKLTAADEVRQLVELYRDMTEKKDDEERKPKRRPQTDEDGQSSSRPTSAVDGSASLAQSRR
eukprot:TRINITY_DN47505_c0_g2_i2.p1 TRINITY_DN47505_c0_g2~~TRINITY_DN47505_c0_g2_i2.p1  ORF type:complete len:181 (+),score=40.02 TRINITY_DN47505_c0_g2_i2:139-681(+)